MAECELSATVTTEKSETTKACIRQASAAEMKTNCATAAGRASVMRLASRSLAPSGAAAACTSAIASARIRA